MHFTLAALLAFGILTLWVPALWPVAVFQVGSFALCLCALWRRPPARLSYPVIPLVTAVIWGLCQIRWGLTAYAFDSRTAVARWATFLAIFLVSSSLFSASHLARWFRSAMVWFAAVVSAWAILQTFTSHGRVLWLFPTGYTTDVMGPIIYHNHWAAFVEIVIPIAVYEALRRERHALLYSAAASVLYASVIASASRAGSALATAEVIAVVVLTALRGSGPLRVIGAKVLPMLLILGALIAVVGGGRVWERFRETHGMDVRHDFNMASVRMVKSHPFAGTGLGTWPTVYPHYADVEIGTYANQAHNDWMQFTAEGGIFFGVMVFSLFVWSIRPALQSIWGIGLLAVFLHAFVDYPFSRPALGAWPILILGMLASRDRRL